MNLVDDNAQDQIFLLLLMLQKQQQQQQQQLHGHAHCTLVYHVNFSNEANF